PIAPTAKAPRRTIPMPNGPSRAIWKRVPCWAKTKVSLYGRGGKSALGGIISGSARGGSGRDVRLWRIVSSLDECMGNAAQGWRSDPACGDDAVEPKGEQRRQAIA